MIRPAYIFLKYICLPLGLALCAASLPLLHGIAAAAVLAMGAVLTAVGAVCAANIFLSRNRSKIDPSLGMETWDIVSDRMHNSNTDLAWFDGKFFLAHAVSPYHLGTPECTLVIKSSADGLHWRQTAVIDGGDDDIRDPKFAVIGGRLFLYVLLNREVEPRPYITMQTWSADGASWAPLAETGHPGWLFWRPRSLDSKTWYVPAYWHRFDKTAMFKSADGLRWDYALPIREGQVINETCFEFLDGGAMIAAGRMEYSKEMPDLLVGHRDCSTMISVSEPPYASFRDSAEDRQTRLDGPVLFRAGGRVFGVGRSQPRQSRVFPKPGAALAKKRTSLYEVTRTGLVFISDLPSAGDTSYAGAVVREGHVYISYYTSDIARDYIWIFGMIEPTAVRMARIPLDRLLRAADDAQRKP